MKRTGTLLSAMAVAIMAGNTPAFAQAHGAKAAIPATTVRESAFPETEVRVATVDPRVVLAGTLLVPESARNGTVVLMVTGTGNYVRDQVISGTPMFRRIAEDLAGAGVATLRLDVRGGGASTGPKATQSTTAERVQDMRAALRSLRSGEHGAIPSVGVLGHRARPQVRGGCQGREA